VLSNRNMVVAFFGYGARIKIGLENIGLENKNT
jgi:hypothetical protein